MLTLSPLASATEAPQATRGLLLDVAIAGNAILAVGEHGAIVRSTDNGRSWEKMQSPASTTLTCIFFADTRNGWAAGHGGIILHTRDAGENWIVQFETAANDTVFLDVIALDPKRIFAVGAYSTFYSSVDGGRAWTQRQVAGDDVHMNRIVVGENSRLYVGCERGVLLRISDLGKNVTALVSPYNGSFYGVLPLGGDALLAYGLRGHAFRSANDGVSWEESVSSGPPALLATGIKLKSGAIVLAGQARATVVSYDDGKTFSPWVIPLTGAISELIEMPDGCLLAVGDSGVTRLDPPSVPSNLEGTR